MNTNTIGTRKELNNAINAYILSVIPTTTEIAQSWGVTAITDADRIKFVMSCFNSEYSHASRQYPNDINRFAEWLQGLPSAINVDFENYRIIEIAKSWGALSANATEKQEQKIIGNWFNYIANKFFQLHKKLAK